MGCLFCQTARCGFVRNLKSYEIIDQIIAVNRVIHPKRVTNVVLMGMGEPLANFVWVVDALWKIVELLVPVKLFVSFACHPPDQFPYKVMFTKLWSSVAEQLNVILAVVDVESFSGTFRVTLGY